MEEQQVFRPAVIGTDPFCNETLSLSAEIEQIEYKKCYECQITFHTDEYSTSREDKGGTIVLKIQGHGGEIAFRVVVQSSVRLPGKPDPCLKAFRLKLKPALVSDASKGRAPF